jgi:hypothetical protein
MMRRVLLLLLLVPALAGAQGGEGRARIAVFTPAAAGPDAGLAAVVADTVELGLLCLDRWEVRRLGAADPSTELSSIRRYCTENRIDQAVGGTVSAREGGGYRFTLVVYDQRSDAVTLRREGASRGTLDVFEATDELLAALLDGLSGRHVLFGSLLVSSEPVEAAVAVNGKGVGVTPVSLRGLPVGTVRVSAMAEGYEGAEVAATIVDGETVRAALELERSTGRVALEMPGDATVTVSSGETGEKEVRAGEETVLPTGRYAAVARCAGLPEAEGELRIHRGELLRWQPWEKGYLAVESDPPGAEIRVDDASRGVTPSVVEVEPGARHRLELRLEKHRAYSVEAGAAAGSKVSVTGTLEPLPGSIRVETSISGARVSMDGEWKDTPATFSEVGAGRHDIVISPILVDRRYYSCGGKFTVDVTPGEEIVVSKTLFAATARLQITDAPPGSTATIDGVPVDPGIFSGLIEVPAGRLEVLVSAGNGQTWGGPVHVLAGADKKMSTVGMVTRLPRGTISVDGAPGDWAEMWPLWTMSKPDIFPDQPGTQMEAVFLCRDDRYLYGRVDFSDGSPTMRASKDIPVKLVYILRVYLAGGDHLFMNINYANSRSEPPWLGTWNTTRRSAAKLSDEIRYKSGGSMLEFSVPLRFLQRIRAGGPYRADYTVASTAVSGDWVKYTMTEAAFIDFGD